MKFSAGSFELSYQESGRGEAVILLHAFPLHRGLWSSTIRTLSSRYQVLALDTLGFGDSTITTSVASSMDFYADHVVRLCEEKKLTKANFVGCSMGGYILFALHARYPNLFRSLVLVDTKAASDSAEVAATREQNAQLFDSAESNKDAMKGFYESMLSRLLGATTHRERPGIVALVRRMMNEASPQGVAAALRAMASRHDHSSRLPSISTPTLVIAGDEDQITPAKDAKVMAGLFPNGSFVEISGAGHLPSIETPDAFDKALMSFLSQLKK